MATAHKLWLGFGTLMGVMVLIVLTLFLWLGTLAERAEDLATAVGPANRAAHTMEIKVNAIGASVLDHLHAPSDAHRERVEKDVAAFRRNLTEYQQMAIASREDELGRQAQQSFQQYELLSHALLNDASEQTSKDDLAAFMDLRLELDAVLDEAQTLTMDRLTPARRLVEDSIYALQTATLALLCAGVVVAGIAGTVVGRAVVATEHDLRESDLRKTTILESALDGVVTTNARGDILEFNPAAERMFGFTRDEALGRALDELVASLGDRKTDQMLGRRLELTATRKSGEQFSVEVSVAATGTFASPQYTAFLRDISAQKHAELAIDEQIRLLKLSSEVGTALTEGAHLRDVLQGCTDALVKNLDAALARIWMFNDRDQVLELKASSGLSTEIEGERARIPLGKYKIGKIAQQRKPLQTNAVIGDPNVPDQQWAEQHGLVAFAGYPLLVENRLVGVMGLFSRQRIEAATLGALASIADEVALGIRHEQAQEELLRSHETLEQRVLERTQELGELNEALSNSNRDLEQFASVASHDLQEPLRKIQAFGDRLQARYGDKLEEQGRQYVERMQSAATRMRKLIDDLLSFSRITTKAQPFTPVDLGAVVAEVVGDLEQRIDDSGGHVEVGELPTIEADPLQIRLLLQNLIANGLKFHKGDQPPVVRIEAELNGADEPTCVLRVSDNGIGFDETYLDRIFEVFQRLHGRQEYEGTGMGLAICRKIVYRHGGTITARSAPDEGATFIVQLPVTHSELEPDEYA